MRLPRVSTCGDTLGRGCFRTLPASEFHVKRPSGRLPRLDMLCKECRRALDRDRYEANPEPKLTARRRYVDANREIVNERQRVYHAENRDERNAALRAQRATAPLRRNLLKPDLHLVMTTTVETSTAERLGALADREQAAREAAHAAAAEFRAAVVEARQAGASYRTVADAAGRSNARIAQIVADEAERRERAA